MEEISQQLVVYLPFLHLRTCRISSRQILSLGTSSQVGFTGRNIDVQPAILGQVGKYLIYIMLHPGSWTLQEFLHN